MSTPMTSQDSLALQTAVIVARAQMARLQELLASAREAAESSGALAVVLEAELQASRWEKEELVLRLAAAQQAAAHQAGALQRELEERTLALSELRSQLERSRREEEQLRAAGGGAALERLARERDALAGKVLERDRWIARQQRELAEKTVRLLRLVRMRDQKRGLGGLFRKLRGAPADEEGALAMSGG